MLFFGKLLTTTAVWMHGIAAAMVVFSKTDSTMAVAVATIAQFVPQLALAPISGAWADRHDPTSQMVLGRACCIAGSLMLVAWLWFRGDFATPAESTIAIGVGSLVVGIGFALGGPAMHSVVPALVRRDELTTAMALNMVPMTVARIAGPSLGALVVVELGPISVFVMTAAAHSVFVPMILLARLPKREKATGHTERPRVLPALSLVARDRPLARALLGVLAVGLGSEPLLTLAPALTHDLGGSPSTVGLLVTAFGVGAGAGLAAVSVLGSAADVERLVRVGLWSLTGGLVGCAAAPVLWLCLASALLMGLGFSVGLTGLSTIVQANAPQDFRGRIMALWMVAFLGSRPVSATLAGVVADVGSTRIAFVVVACAVAALTVGSTASAG